MHNHETELFIDTFDTFSLFASSIPAMMRQHVAVIMEAGPTSRFYCRIEDNDPNIEVYLLEYNQSEAYSNYHCFSADRIADDYEYRSIPLEQVRSMERFAARLII